MDGQYESKPPASIEPSLEMQAIMEKMRKAMEDNPEDIDQTALIKVIQENRANILQYAMGQYLQNPKSASLLEGVTSLIGQMESTVRNDRKERAKKKDAENNVLSFNQMLDAMQNISNGAIVIPHFDMSDFILDPSKTLLTQADVAPIKPEELVQGNELIDIDGNAV
jgi:hypothetical protein